jgi:hypothetical protein
VPCGASPLATDISGAVSGETLSLAGFCRYVLSTALPAIGNNLIIRGKEATIERSYVSGTLDFSILTVNSGDLTVSDLNFRNGHSENGGAIDSQGGILVVTGGTFTGNTASGDGGAIDNFNPDSAELTVADATFASNAAGAGGGIYNYDELTATGSIFSHNAGLTGGGIDNQWYATVTRSVFGQNAAGSDGGAIDNGYVATVTDATLHDNQAQSDGGAIYNGDGIQGFPGTLGIADGHIRGNLAQDGGGIYDGDGPVTLSGADVEQNHPDNCAPANSVGGCRG